MHLLSFLVVCSAQHEYLSISDNGQIVYGILSRSYRGPVVIPDSVKIIEKRAFAGNKLLTSLVIGKNVEIIRSEAFAYCSGLTGSLFIPSSVKHIEYSAFEYCSGFTGALVISNGVQTIDNFAFNECHGFTGSLVIPDSVKQIGDYCFANCAGFTGSLVIPNSVKIVSYAAFTKCSGITEVHFGKSLTKIEIYAFAQCSSLRVCYFSGSSVSIEAYAFSETEKLEKYVETNKCQGFSFGLPILKKVECVAPLAPFTKAFTQQFRPSKIAQAALNGLISSLFLLF